MKLYLAGRFLRLLEFRKMADELKEDGHQITSSWVYGSEEGKTFDEIAITDLEDVKACDTVVSFTEPYGSSNQGGGRHVEFGYALGLKKGMILVGEKEVIFHWIPGVLQLPSFNHLKNYLKGKS
jgi:nucleoside 2-deoxyribosyltransferase